MDDNEGSTAEVVETSMDDTLRETLAAINARGEGIEEVQETAEKAPEDAVEKAQRLRDEQGKFKAEEAPAEFVVPPELQRLGLKKEEAQAFMQAPEAVKQAFMRRSDEMGKGIEQYKAKAQFAESVERVIAPHMNTIQSLGVTPDVAIGELLKADHVLRYGSPEQKAQKFAQLARDYGVQLNGESPQIAPEMQGMYQRLQRAEQMINQFQTLEQQREQQSLNSQIEAFRADPAHAHFDDVRGHMAALIQAGQAQDLKSAYEQAIWANPAVRATLIAQQQEAARAEALKKATEAKQAASVNVRRRPALPASEPIGSMEDTIRSTLRKLQAA